MEGGEAGRVGLMAFKVNKYINLIIHHEVFGFDVLIKVLIFNSATSSEYKKRCNCFIEVLF